ncbi:MAG: bifunctional 4-hydroxy-2-oxoglutarate aldolase/2-dehydro-3-deoxy-phosphogluconate aldolase [Lachnospiraceae bacterium]|nr:bifunctional 4-hydroxy-2-oxoglutarate aldolase/2-dehydro-3-deoxy-phosphogluconate aldolase [Lachnospiraceae bacterium]
MCGKRIRQVIEEIRRYKIVVIVRGMEPELCSTLSEALYAGGIRLMEITFDQNGRIPFEKTKDAILTLSKMWKDKMQIGAGTVLSIQQLYMAKEAGAGYIVTPNTNPAIIREAKKLDMAVLAGAMTPSEIEEAYEAGADFVKLFPAAIVGTEYVRAVRAPLSHIPMLAVGGVNENNISDFLKTGVAGVGVGGNLVDPKLVMNRDYDKITALARQYVISAGVEEVVCPG